MDFQERMLAHVLAAAADRHGLDITIPVVPFPRITMTEAQRTLRAQGWDGPAADLNPEGERRLAAQASHGSRSSPATPPASGPFTTCAQPTGRT
jgi:hypothetical protein